MVMQNRTLVFLLGVLACGGCSSKEAAPAAGNEKTEERVVAKLPSEPRALTNTSRDQFLSRGRPTFVVGTAGDEVADHRIATQVELLRGLALPDAGVVADHSIDVFKGAAGWPPNPVLYGGVHENSVLAVLAPTLPFSLSAERIEIGGKVYEGEGYRLVVVVPARGADESGPGYPEFLLFAGTGAGGIAEINAGLPGGAPIVIADAFGSLITGTWTAGNGAALHGDLSGPPQRRIAYRSVERELRSVDGSGASVVSFRFPEMVEQHSDEPALIDACMRGLETVVRRLEIANPVALSVYVYPDVRSKESLTGTGGHGHAVPSSRALHVLQLGGKDIAAMEALLAHEGTHVLGYYAWGPPGTALMGEGLAVWVSGKYRGKSLEQWKSGISAMPAIETMLSVGWKGLEEAEKYPPAGMLVEAAMRLVGPAKLRQHLLGATFETWPQACAQAGTTNDALQAAMKR